MKSILKTALVGASLLATTSAFADVALPGSDNGELVLFVKNNDTGAVYARGLVTQINSVATAAYIASDLSYAPGKEVAFAGTSFAADANLTSFLNATQSFSYSVIAADTSVTNGSLLGAQRYAFTSTSLDPTNAPFNTDLSSYQGAQAAMQQLNVILTGAVGSGNSTASNGVWGQAGTPGEFMQDWFGTGVFNDVAVGSSASFYMVSSGGNGNTGVSHVYLAGSYALSALGNLEFTPNAVPLPAAVWLLLSGLGGLGVIGRKKNALVAQAA